MVECVTRSVNKYITNACMQWVRTYLEHGVAGEVAIGVVSPDAAGWAEASVVGDRGGEDGKQEEVLVHPFQDALGPRRLLLR